MFAKLAQMDHHKHFEKMKLQKPSPVRRGSTHYPRCCFIHVPNLPVQLCVVFAAWCFPCHPSWLQRLQLHFQPNGVGSSVCGVILQGTSVNLARLLS